MRSKIKFLKTLLIASLFTINLLSAQTTFTYLGTYSTNGRPNYLVTPSDVISTAFATRIRNSLPDNYPVPTYNPQYLTENVVTDLSIDKESDVWVTFFDEGAGFQNSLAFYTYPLSQPPTVKPTSLTVIFPNLSLENNILRRGEKVFLGRFPANTGIGFALVSNGFQNGRVSSSATIYYSNPDFNPERQRRHRKHSVLLRDISGVAVTGFEDLDRSTSGADNDFNDAIFYSTISPIIACTTCPPTVGTGNGGVSSGNTGGLESEGCLASAIAERNFNRAKTPSVSFDNPENLQAFTTPTGDLAIRNDVELEQYIPDQPFYQQPVKAALTTPTDLLGVTNAKKVLSVDYFDMATTERVAAVLTTKTENKVYDHTKVICDRLTGSTLINAETIIIDEIPFIRATLERENGAFEYAILFSINKTSATTATVVSRWSTEEYPTLDSYFNYQVWAEAPHLAQRVVEEILAKHRAQSTLTTLEGTIAPQVYVIKGNYDNGLLTLKIYNPVGAKSLTINGNMTSSETNVRTDFTKQVSLKGDVEETIQLYVGSIFDMGFTIRNDKSNGFDALYFADGAWGVEYDKKVSKVDKFVVNAGIPSTQSNSFTIERNPIVNAQVKDYISLFRSLRAASTEADMTKYNNLSFEAQGSNVVEITLVKKSITEWSKQYRTEVSLFDSKQKYNLPLSIFTNGTGEKFDAKDITHIVFTLTNTTKVIKTVDLALENVHFNVNTTKVATIENDALSAYPNPTNGQTTVAFNLPERGTAYITLSNAQGQVLIERTTEMARGFNQIPLDLTGIPSGLYIASVMSGKSKMMTKIFVP